MDLFSVEMLRSMPDEALVSVCTDQPRAFEVLFERYRPTVVSMAKSFAVNAADAEDYAQEGMFGLLAAVAAYSQDQPAGFRTFAAVCIRNRMRNLFRKEYAEKRAGSDLPDVSLDDPENQMAETLADQAETPEEIVLEKEEASALYQQVADVLSTQEREIFWLSVSGHSYEEIAAILQVSAKSVDNAIQRSRRKLRAVWSQKDTAADPQAEP
jgi:RNA polymerase sporulation-specific sigma factor